jgi:hypothetical protein
MSWMQQFLNEPLSSSAITFWGLFILLACSAYAGKYIFKSNQNSINDDQAKIVLGAILSLLGLLIGFVLSISIGGYNDRQRTEENEMIVIGTAIQRTQLLPLDQRENAHRLLHEYLDARIDFFNSNTQLENKKWRIISAEKQNKLWDIAVAEANKAPTPITASILTAYDNLYISQEKTTVSWRYQIPDMVWGLLIFFAVVSNFLIGYNARKEKHINLLILVLPFLMTLALFIIAEIDIPGKGVIHVTPDDLLSLKEILNNE